ncbi:MAG: M23 family metallopeptidase [Deltaproteobacteria bacterium]|nr:M23 family metallopeptidase [Deltaproteobacteria bacterium]
MKKGLIFVFIVILIGILIYLFVPIGKNPISINIEYPVEYFTNKKPIVLSIRDKQTGIKDIEIKLIALDTPIELYKRHFEDKDMKTVNLRLQVKKQLPQGEAHLLIQVRDHSTKNLFKGNVLSVEKKIIIDTISPRIVILSGANRVKVGGAGVAIFQAKDKNLKSVYLTVNERKFNAYPAKSLFGEDDVYLSFFGYDIKNKLKNWRTTVVATDKAGNISLAHVPVFWESFKLRRRTVKVTKSLIEEKIKEILGDNFNPQNPLQSFISVNRNMREEDEKQIEKICQDSVTKMLWHGRFIHSGGCKVTSTFEIRDYIYNGRKIDREYHLGYDLASVRNAPVVAANDGIVKWAGFLGIYGNTVIIDHGLGLFSLYAHLGNIYVRAGQNVKKGQRIACTDTTGLACGDHLHFSILANGLFVNPLEWWDGRWIDSHIMNKIEEAKENLAIGKLSKY